jgi:hypothetical protein
MNIISLGKTIVQNYFFMKALTHKLGAIFVFDLIAPLFLMQPRPIAFFNPKF